MSCSVPPSQGPVSSVAHRTGQINLGKASTPVMTGPQVTNARTALTDRFYRQLGTTLVSARVILLCDAPIPRHLYVSLCGHSLCHGSVGSTLLPH